MAMSQQLMVTGVVFLVAVASFVGLTIKDRRPRDNFDTPLLPTTPLLMISAFVGLFALLALLYLLGARS
jgi:hypothetical protein